MNTNCRYLTAKILLFILYAVSFSASLVALISGAFSLNVFHCERGFLPLAIWQIIYGAIRIPIFITLILSYECLKIEKNTVTARTTIPRILFVTFIFAILFDIFWSIIGSINLFAFASTCYADGFRLWVVTVYCLAVEYVSILAFTCHFFWHLTHT
jgi:hypothetical protein